MTPRTNDGKEKKEKGKEGRGMVNFSLLPVTLSPRWGENDGSARV